MSKTPTFERSWKLFCCSSRLLAQRKNLLLFPLLSLFFLALIVVSYLAPTIFLPTGYAWTEFAHWQAVGQHFLDSLFAGESGHLHLTRKAYGYFALGYLPAMIGATFFNVAFYHQVMKAFAGENVTVGAGLRFACQRWRSILYWSVFAGLVGLLIQLLAERVGWIGRLGLRLAGMAWSVASVFVIPVMIREADSNPIHLLRHSATTVRKTWGESLVGFVGIQLLIVVPVIALGLVMAFRSAMHVGHVSTLSIVMTWIVVVLATRLLTMPVTHVYRCALYIYASEGVVPGPFTEEQMHQAWKVRGGGAT